MGNFGLHKDLNMLLTAVRNIWQLDNNVNGTHSLVSMATPNSFIRFCIVYSDTAQQYIHKTQDYVSMVTIVMRTLHIIT